MSRKQNAFTLVELMVSMGILILMLVIMLQMTNQTAATWKSSAAKAEQFQEARKAFETMTQRISNATLNTYLDYAYDPKISTTQIVASTGSASTIATDYVRQSDLRFRVVQMGDQTLDPGSGAVMRPTHGIFFQAPFGIVDDTTRLSQLDDLLNSWGYFLEISNSNANVPAFLKNQPGYGAANPKYRCHLMEFRQSAEEFTIYTTLNTLLQQQISAKVPFPNRDPVPDNNGKVGPGDDAWFMNAVNYGANASDPTLAPFGRPVRVLAENIIALVIYPRLSATDQNQRNNDTTVPQQYKLLTPDYTYHSKQTSNYTNGTVPPPQVNSPPTPAQITIAGTINPKNQLPPVVEVAMVAVDEASAQKLQTKYGQKLGLDTLLVDSQKGNNLFVDPTVLEQGRTANPSDKGDLAILEANLIAENVNYRIFTSNIILRGAKWSRTSTK